jgi:hypothetical protein
MFRVVLPPIIRSAYNCIYNIWYLSHRYWYLRLSWKSWNRFECAVGGVRVWQIPDAVDTVVCAPDDGWKYYPKHVEKFPDINKLCNVASCWIYIGIHLGAHPILHISRIRVNRLSLFLPIAQQPLVLHGLIIEVSWPHLDPSVIPASERRQTHSLDRASTGIG